MRVILAQGKIEWLSNDRSNVTRQDEPSACFLEWWAQPWVWSSGEGEKKKEGFLLAVRAGLLRQWNLNPESGPLQSSYWLRNLRIELASVFPVISHWTVCSSRSGVLITLSNLLSL